MKMERRLDAVVSEAIAGNRIVGCEIIVARHGDIVYRRAAGHQDRDGSVAMPENAIYLLASVTKPIVAATALAMVDAGLLGLEDRVSDHLPYFAPKLEDGTPAPITIHHLLTHTAGLSYSYPLDPEISGGLGPSNASFEENFSRVAKQKLLFAPGTGWTYSVAIDVLGAVLARVHGGSLDEAARKHVTGPLGMGETGFFIAAPDRLAKPYADGQPPMPMTDPQVVYDENGEPVEFAPSRIGNARAFQSGGAGMAGTPGDIFRLLEAFRTGGILQPETLALARTNRIGDVPRDDAGLRFGYLGAVVDDPVAAETPASAGSVSWGGIYGHSWLVDPSNGLTVLSMSNTALEGCLGQFPLDVRSAAYADFA